MSTSGLHTRTAARPYTLHTYSYSSPKDLSIVRVRKCPSSLGTWLVSMCREPGSNTPNLRDSDVTGQMQERLPGMKNTAPDVMGTEEVGRAGDQMGRALEQLLTVTEVEEADLAFRETKTPMSMNQALGKEKKNSKIWNSSGWTEGQPRKQEASHTGVSLRLRWSGDWEVR